MNYSFFIEEMAENEKNVRHLSFVVKGVKFEVSLSPIPDFASGVLPSSRNIWNATIEVATEKQHLWLGKFSLNEANEILNELKEKYNGEEN